VMPQPFRNRAQITLEGGVRNNHPPFSNLARRVFEVVEHRAETLNTLRHLGHSFMIRQSNRPPNGSISPRSQNQPKSNVISSLR
jgi:hypothetical protein